MVFQVACLLLTRCSVIQTGMEFLYFYRDQPLFSEVELFLYAELDFIFHRFWEDNLAIISQ
jgi:hypothetical protein